jgi:colanic acid/amylovoran biosynthesis glycosyltransferase
MAAGLVVVGTTAGGSREILIDGVNSLTFQPEDADALAQCIVRLLNEPELYSKLANHAREDVLRRFGVQRMFDEIEQYLTSIVNGTPKIDELGSPLA